MSYPCRLLATCSADQTCKIWRTSNFSLMTELSIKSNNPGETSRGWMWDCAFSGDSQYIVTGETLLTCPCRLVGQCWVLTQDIAGSPGGTLPNPSAPMYVRKENSSVRAPSLTPTLLSEIPSAFSLCYNRRQQMLC